MSAPVATGVPSRTPEQVVDRAGLVDRVAVVRRGRTRLLRSFERDLLVDMAMLTAAIGAALVTAQLAGLPDRSLLWIAGFPVLFLVLMGVRGMYRARLAPSLLEDFRTIVAAAAVAALSTTFIATLGTGDPDVAGQAVRAWLFTVAYVTAGRGGTRLADASAAKAGRAARATVIIGAGRVGHMLAKRMLDHPERGLRPVGFFDADPLDLPDGAPIPVLCSPDDSAKVEAMVRWHGIEQAILSFSMSDHDGDLAIARRLIDLGVSVAVVPRLFEGIPDDIALDRVAGVPLIAIHPSSPRSLGLRVRYLLEQMVAAMLLVLIAPLMAMLALGVLISVGRPVIFRQERVGRDGRPFQMLKFRTMRGDPASLGEADADWAAQIVGSPEPAPAPVPVAPGAGPPVAAPPAAATGEDRRTRFGALLRSTSLDELPQLVNVARGEMSLVGPRPERQAYAEAFSEHVRRYGDRHRVKAGLTGWAQVNGLRGKTSIDDRVESDNYYIDNWSPWLDFKIMLLTLVALFRDRPQ